MNILFYENGVNPLKGGVERVSYSIAKHLQQYGIVSFVCYLAEEQDTGEAREVFRELLHLPGQTRNSSAILANFIKENNISVIINQKAEKKTVRFLRNAIADTDIRIYSFLHTSPTASRDVMHYRDWRFPIHTLRSIAKELLYLVYKFDRIDQKQVCKYSDKVILLSKRFIPDFCANTRCRDLSKIDAIPNITTYSSEETASVDLKGKEQLIIVVSRMGEAVKRISIILDLWEKTMALLPDWKLIMIGDGPDLPRYKELAHKNQLRNIEFVGYADPYEFYKKASVFLSTSATEGRPMTIIEAQQMGVVPMATDNYKALHDLIENGKTGFILPSNDVAKFVSTLHAICIDEERRQNIALQAMAASRNYMPKYVIPYWLKLLKYDNK